MYMYVHFDGVHSRLSPEFTLSLHVHVQCSLILFNVQCTIPASHANQLVVAHH